jgi:hypothetical protein
MFKSFAEALEALAYEWNLPGRNRKYTDVFGIEHYLPMFLPDPEDDRVVIWEVTEGQHRKAVWHFSGWHWSPNAEDLPGGPLDQGTLDSISGLPRYWWGKSLYEMAMADY